MIYLFTLCATSIFATEEWRNFSDPEFAEYVKLTYEERALPTSRDHSYNPHVDKLIWNSVSKYFLPQSHPMRDTLDTIFFSRDRVTQSEKSLKKAGFKIIHKGSWSNMIVASHRNLEGYLVKLYTDEEPDVVDWAKCKERVKGARSAAACITKNGWCTYFKVPNKWIYPLPAHPSPPHELRRKNFILLVEDAELISADTNLRKWESSEVTKEMLHALYWLLKKEGLRDSVFPFNLPFSRDGRIAIIDTEFHHEWPVPFKRLTPYLSQENQGHWNRLHE